jgi:hypothetical protein
MRRARTWALGLATLGLALSGCSSPAAPPPKAPEAPKFDPAENAAIEARMRGWEPGSLMTHEVRLPNGMASMTTESATPPRVACERGDDGDEHCTVNLDLGVDPDQDKHEIECAFFAYQDPLPFGVMVSRMAEGWTLQEMPKLDIGATSSGALFSRFEAPVTKDTEEHHYIGTLMTAARYAPGSLVLCSSTQAGGSAAFRRIVGKLFDSVQMKADESTVFQRVVRARKGDQVVGFRFDLVRKNDEGFVETGTSFFLTASEESWRTNDVNHHIDRDLRGAVESYRTAFLRGKGASGVLTGKPGEGGRFRLKLEAGGHTNAIELTPEVPVSTELWEAGALKKVARGAQPKHKYAFLSVGADGDPSFSYSSLTRVSEDTLTETIDPHGKPKKSGAPKQSNELHINAAGVVTKQVSADTIYEQLHLSGNLPQVKASKGAPKTKGATK